MLILIVDSDKCTLPTVFFVPQRVVSNSDSRKNGKKGCELRRIHTLTNKNKKKHKTK